MTYKSRISIQVSLGGYSFRIEDEQGKRFSGWQTPDHVFTSPELQSRYDEVDISLMTPKCTLVPPHFFDPSRAREILSEVVELDSNDAVEYVAMPESGNVMVFSRSIGETLSRVMADTVVRSDGYKARILPELYFILREVGSVREYNRIVASYADGWLYLAVSQGRTLQLCNVFRAADFTTAEYYIFLVMKKLQLNPEISPVYFRTPLGPEQEMSLYRYFKDVIQI